MCRRCTPMARATPSSDRRSAASMTKIRKMSSTPARMEKVPKIVKIEEKMVPAMPEIATTVVLFNGSSTSIWFTWSSHACHSARPDSGTGSWRSQSRTSLSASASLTLPVSASSSPACRSARRWGSVFPGTREPKRSEANASPSCPSLEGVTTSVDPASDSWSAGATRFATASSKIGRTSGVRR